MIAPSLVSDIDVQELLAILREEYGKAHPTARIEAYRYDDCTIRVRIIDPALKTLHMADRSEPIWEILRKKLRKKTRQDVTFLILLTPAEAKKSAMSMEFDDPSPAD